MECPYCHKALTEVKNSRPTKSNTQVWRRRECINCGRTFTTHEIIDLSHIVVIKKSGKPERFNWIKLYSGIYGSTLGLKIPNRERVVDKITREVEKEILNTKQKKIATFKISDIVLKVLKKSHSGLFLRFLSYNKDITNQSQLKKALDKYLS